ncbi:exosortase E/protease (VPEID-CTERM system) [Novosphingobium sp. SG751A]|uniref:CAAX prenyl protease-related protein n=1 Tax=Novosphingobium sp. SG751A TaxID=2587000 RepID=UPI0015541E78|nr:CAAX prenyl protease-related protein [Novosphingobium sp. SG751A]NOW47683.1 exosortase E/protease (VPEID-CTERM system) [Novosphingobium sp. SG751A]
MAATATSSFAAHAPRILTALGQIALLGLVVLASDTKYANPNLSGSLLQQVLTWLPALIQGLVLGGAAGLVHAAMGDAGLIGRVLNAPVPRALALGHGAIGLMLVAGSVISPPLMALDTSGLNAAQLFYLAAPALWLAYLATGWLVAIPAGALDGGRRLGDILALCGAITLAMFAWHYVDRTQSANSYAITDACVTIASWFSLLAGNPIHPIGINERGWPLYQTGDITVSIAPSCAGIEGLLLTTALLLTLVALERRRLYVGRALALIVVAAGLTFVINALRLAMLFYIGDHWSPQIAVNGFHSNFGVLTLVVVCAGFTMAIRRFASRTPVDGQTHAQQVAPAPAYAPAPTGHHNIRLIVPQMAMIACLLLLGLISGEFDWPYPIGVIVVGAVLWRMKDLRPLAGWQVTPLPVLAGLVAFALWIALVPADPLVSARFEDTLFGVPVVASCLWLAFRLAGSVLLAPLVEEMAFRGFLLPWLADRAQITLPRPIARAGALLATSIVFGLVHADVLAGIAAGLVYGAVQMRRGQYADAILAHCVTNSCLCLYALSTGQWNYL